MTLLLISLHIIFLDIPTQFVPDSGVKERVFRLTHKYYKLRIETSSKSVNEFPSTKGLAFLAEVRNVRTLQKLLPLGISS